ncbi:MAG: hypothetical protein KKF89_00360 [Nanoarchaeota archaeon]|nr:hypothetical protein [Patescibacteria group bacterium]MBU1854148.1 hypothetical protein [Nanoarchaeota archaeon]
MVWSFESSIYALWDIGVVDVILPFLIIFTLVFAALEKSHILGKDSKKFNVVIALCMGFSVIIPHVLWGSRDPSNAFLGNGMLDVVNIMNKALPDVSLVLIAFVMVMLILGIIGGDVNFAGTSLGGIAMVIAIIAVLVVFLSAANVWRTLPWWLRWVQDPYVKEVVVVLLVFGIIIGFITKDDKNSKEKGFKHFMEDLTKIFPGRK